MKKFMDGTLRAATGAAVSGKVFHRTLRKKSTVRRAVGKVNNSQDKNTGTCKQYIKVFFDDEWNLISKVKINLCKTIAVVNFIFGLRIWDT